MKATVRPLSPWLIFLRGMGWGAIAGGVLFTVSHYGQAHAADGLPAGHLGEDSPKQHLEQMEAETGSVARLRRDQAVFLIGRSVISQGGVRIGRVSDVAMGHDGRVRAIVAAIWDHTAPAAQKQVLIPATEAAVLRINVGVTWSETDLERARAFQPAQSDRLLSHWLDALEARVLLDPSDAKRAGLDPA